MSLPAAAPAETAPEVIQVNSPADGFNTTNRNLVVGWNGIGAQHTHYRILFSRTEGFSQPEISLNTTNTYLTINSIDTGKWKLKVEAFNGSSLVAESGTVGFEVFSIPSFSVSTDLSEYEPSKVVIFRIDAPAGSKVDISVKGQNDRISYHPASLAVAEFRSVLEPGHYEINANLTYYDYFASFSSEFDAALSTPAASQQSQSGSDASSGNSSEPAKYMLNVTVYGRNGDRLKYVIIRYRSADRDAPYYLNETDVIGTDGNKMLSLYPYDYILDFEKEGHASKTTLVELDYRNVSLNVTLDEDNGADAAQLSQGEAELGNITVLSPANGTVLDSPLVRFAFSLDYPERQDECRLMVAGQQQAGWEVKASSSEIAGKEQSFSLNSLPNGEYMAKLQCTGIAGGTAGSEPVFFTVKRLITDNSITEGKLVAVNHLLQKIESLAPEHKAIIGRTGQPKALEESRKELESLNAEYNDILNSGLSQDSIDSARSRISGRAEALMAGLASDVLVKNIDSIALYLPFSGFEEAYRKYHLLSEGGKDSSGSDVKRQKLFQENFIVRLDVKELELAYTGGDARKFKVVTGEISAARPLPNPGGLISAARLIFYDGSGLESKALDFVADSKEIGNGFYELGRDSEGKFTFYLDGEAGLEEVKSARIMLLAGRNSSLDTPTGLTVSDIDIGGMLGSSALWISAIVILAVLGMASIMLYFSPEWVESRKVSSLASRINTAFDLLKSQQYKKAFSLYPGIISAHAALAKPYRNELSGVMKRLHDELDAYNMDIMLDRLTKIIVEIANEHSFDDRKYSAFLGQYQKAAEAYNRMDDSLKERFHSRIGQFYRMIMEIEGAHGQQAK